MRALRTSHVVSHKGPRTQRSGHRSSVTGHRPSTIGHHSRCATPVTNTLFPFLFLPSSCLPRIFRSGHLHFRPYNESREGEPEFGKGDEYAARISRQTSSRHVSSRLVTPSTEYCLKSKSSEKVSTRERTKRWRHLPATLPTAAKVYITYTIRTYTYTQRVSIEH